MAHDNVDHAEDRAVKVLVEHYSDSIHTRFPADEDPEGATLRRLLDDLSEIPISDRLFRSYALYVRPVVVDEGNKIQDRKLMCLLQYSCFVQQRINRRGAPENTEPFAQVLTECVKTISVDTSLFMEPSETREKINETEQRNRIRLACLESILRLQRSIVQLIPSMILPDECIVSWLAITKKIQLNQLYNVSFVPKDVCAYPPPGKSIIDCPLRVQPEVQLDGSYWSTDTACKLQSTLYSELGNDPSTAITQRGANLAKAVRAHFFGRDLVDRRPKPTKLHLGRTVPHERNEEKPYSRNPNRLHATLMYISLLPKDCDESILEEIWPVLYELLDANLDVPMTFGAAAVIWLLSGENSTPSDVVLHNLQHLLDHAVRITREGPILTVIGAVQRRVVSLLPPDGQLEHYKKMVSQWLIPLDKNRNNIDLSRGLLLGGVVPLLYDVSQRGDAMELGRMGLTVLLPLFRHECESGPQRDLRIGTCVGLLNLFVIAHPIMSRHGGKIMTELLACIGNHQKDDDVMQLLYHTAMSARVVGSKRAEEVLIDVSTSGEYTEDLVLHANRILNANGG